MGFAMAEVVVWVFPAVVKVLPKIILERIKGRYENLIGRSQAVFHSGSILTFRESFHGVSMTKYEGAKWI